MLQRLMRILSERALTDEFAGIGDYRCICGFRHVTPSREFFTYF